MHFHIEETADNSVVGWVLPDNPATVPIIKVLRPDGSVEEILANTMRTDLRDKGMHETGMAGFVLDKSKLSGECGGNNFELRDSDKNVLLFRTFNQDQHLTQKLFRYDLSAMPVHNLDASFAKRFTLYYTGIERYPFDTLFGILNNPVAKSVYASGRPSFQRYEQLLKDREFKIVTLLRNPYEEMAERLLFAFFVSRPDSASFLSDHLSGLESLVELAKVMNFRDPGAVKSAISDASDEQRKALANPYLRALACGPDETPKPGHVEIALYKLSTMDIVCLRNRFDEFKSMLTDLLTVDVLGKLTPTELGAVQPLAETLADIRVVRDLIALDLDFYSFAEEAITNVLSKTATQLPLTPSPS
jgi:hypothetical protein